MLWRDYAHLKSVATASAIDVDGRPLPWYTYPAIEFVSQLDFSDKTVFEFGSGNSTLFWASVAHCVVSVEDDEHWFESVRARIPPNADVILETDLSEFPRVLLRLGKAFDVIVVDGPARGGTRLKCSMAAVKALNPGGVIILDDSDWLPRSSKWLRESGLLEVDMTGFAPICGHVQTTSFFFDRRFAVPPRHGRQPMPVRGSRHEIWEREFVPVPGQVIECDGEMFGAVAAERSIVFTTPEGPRTFRAFTYLLDGRQRAIGIVDEDRRRVLLAGHLKGRESQHDRELRRLASLSWDEFRAMIKLHDFRRYLI